MPTANNPNVSYDDVKVIGKAFGFLRKAKAELVTAVRDRDIWKQRYEGLYAEVKDFLSAIRNFPDKLRAFIKGHWHERQVQKPLNREVAL